VIGVLVHIEREDRGSACQCVAMIGACGRAATTRAAPIRIRLLRARSLQGITLIWRHQRVQRSHDKGPGVCPIAMLK
jgi:hypothetical protein